MNVGQAKVGAHQAHRVGPVVSAAHRSSLTVFQIVPDVMKESLVWSHELYKKPIIICENGFGDSVGYGLHDHQRAAYHSAFLRSVVTSVKDFGVEVLAYSAWSLVDSFEFTAGYDRPFGLVHVDYASGSLNRTLKDSASFWTEMADTGVVPYVEPDQSGTTAPPASTTPSSAPVSVASWLWLAILASLTRL
ncbi:hypothetical protein ONE63_001127 [Megalurothrips usitatus]|uniref:Myrosinase 1-like n=1 Tax=Megalurothrips usitatus TaxID=439358 RepID=A0AAV7XB79_9NEOP|nr:hypothetical protein ONE63_001127 [Megalurothrips usitatus]